LPYGRHRGSKNYRQIMDARSVADGGGGGGDALAARPPCGLLAGEAPGPPGLHALMDAHVLVAWRRTWEVLHPGDAPGLSWPFCTVACTARPWSEQGLMRAMREVPGESSASLFRQQPLLL
jgi:hypothetical protein